MFSPFFYKTPPPFVPYEKAVVAKNTPTLVQSNQLRRIRINEGLRIAELARQARVSPKTIQDIEGGRRTAREVTLRRILNAINRNPQRVCKEEYGFEEVFPPDQRKLF
jgi:transcriptional regulator with XRE-family HTH domain